MQRFQMARISSCRQTRQCCRDRSIARVRMEHDAANAVGLRWCTTGRHRVSAAACMSTGGVLLACCLACRERQNEAYAAHIAAAAVDQNAEQDAIDDRDGVAIEPIVDDEFGDDTEPISLAIALFHRRRNSYFKTCDSNWPTSRCKSALLAVNVVSISSIVIDRICWFCFLARE
jgi:hypothetical protein